MNLRIGPVGKVLAPGYSWCHRCRTPWKFVEAHVTDYLKGRGCFPLCEKCWAELETPDARLPYYRELWMEWEFRGGLWDNIEKAVREGG